MRCKQRLSKQFYTQQRKKLSNWSTQREKMKPKKFTCTNFVPCSESKQKRRMSEQKNSFIFSRENDENGMVMFTEMCTFAIDVRGDSDRFD